MLRYTISMSTSVKILLIKVRVVYRETEHRTRLNKISLPLPHCVGKGEIVPVL